jgi:hypothetical protein
MWRILKAEIIYDKLRTVIFFFFCTVVFFTIWFGVKWERNRIPMMLLMILVLTLSAVYAGEKTRTIQKRDRLHVLLPAILWQIGLAHLLYPIFVLLSICLLLFLSALVVQPFIRYSLTVPSLLHMLTLTGLVLIVNAVILLHRDLRMTFTKKYQRFFVFLFWFLVYVGALLPFYVITNFFGLFGENTPAQRYLTGLLESPALFILLGIFLSVICVIVFVKRKSYIES